VLITVVTGAPCFFLPCRIYSLLGNMSRAGKGRRSRVRRERPRPGDVHDPAFTARWPLCSECNTGDAIHRGPGVNGVQKFNHGPFPFPANDYVEMVQKRRGIAGRKRPSRNEEFAMRTQFTRKPYAVFTHGNHAIDAHGIGFCRQSLRERIFACQERTVEHSHVTAVLSERGRDIADPSGGNRKTDRSRRGRKYG